MIFSVIQYWWH